MSSLGWLAVICCYLFGWVTASRMYATDRWQFLPGLGGCTPAEAVGEGFLWPASLFFWLAHWIVACIVACIVGDLKGPDGRKLSSCAKADDRMSLWFTLRVNDMGSLGNVSIQRIEPAGPPPLRPDTVCTYKVRLDGRELGKVQHRYGDGAFTLARKALELIEKNR